MIKKTVILFILLSFLLAPYSFSFKNVNLINAETIIFSSEISEDTTWTLAESPYIVSVNIIIQEGFTLTIEPGVIVKFEQNSLMARGALNVLGEEGNPVIFTSIHDDARGGQSASWSSGNPLPGDWGAIRAELNGSVNLNYAIINYGGKEQIFQVDNRNIIKKNTAYAQFYYSIGAVSSNGHSIEISNSEIAYNEIGVTASLDSSVIISDSKIYSNVEAGIFNYNDTASINATNNWWGDNSGPYHATLNPNGQGNSVSDNVIFEPWIGQGAEQVLDPVIIVPGIMGSLGVIGDDTYTMDPILHTYDNLIEAMINAGYELDKNLFPFPYEWRKTNFETAAEYLKEKIDDVKEICDCEKVDIVAHSMGGLISRFYVQSNGYEDDVDQLIFLDTPHEGASESYLSNEGGYFYGQNKIVNYLKKYIFQIEATINGYFSLVEYIRNEVPSVYQLLPIYDYLLRKTGNEWQYSSYPDTYPTNSFIEEINEEIGTERLKQRVEATNIYSYLDSVSSDSTITDIKVIPDPISNDLKWNHGYPECLETDNNDCIINGPGDGTVPLDSLSSLEEVDEIIISDTGHRGIVTKAQKEVIEILTGARPEEYYSGPWSALKRMLFIRVYSPIDIQVIAPDGKKIGKNFAGNISINEIEGAYYSGFGDEAEFVLINNPLDGEYRVEIEGTGDGDYGLAIDEITDDQASYAEEENIVNGTISMGGQKTYKIEYSEENGNEIEIKEAEEINPFSKTKDDIESLYSMGEIKKENIRNHLLKRIERFEKKYGKIEKKKKKWKKRLLKKHLKKSSQRLKRKLKHYYKKKKITENAYNILVDDINNIINYIYGK